MAAAIGSTLGRAGWWIVGLASFLVRGGLLLVLVPLVMPPTPAEIGGLLGPEIVGSGLATPTPALMTLVLLLVVGLAAALVVTSLVGAWLEVTLVATMFEEPELRTGDPAAATPAGFQGVVLRAAAARLIAHVPTAVAAVIALAAIAGVAQDELTSPSGTGPLEGRILGRAIGPVAVTILVWLVAEAWAGVATRHLVLGGSFGEALGRGLAGVARPSGLATLVLGTAAAGLPLLALSLAAGRAYDRLWPLVFDGADPRLIVAALGLLVATWAVGLWLVGIGLAWRSAAWSAEVLRHTAG